MIFNPATDEDDAASDPRRSTEGVDAGGRASPDNAYLQSAHQGDLDAGGDEPALAGSDPEGLEDEARFAEEEDEDRALLAASLDGEQFLYDAGAHFPDLDMSGPVFFQIEGPAWAEINPATGLVSGQPGVGDVGAFTFEVVVADASGARFTTTLELTVEMHDGAPVVTEAFARPAISEAPADGDVGAEAEQSVAGSTADADASEAPPALDEVEEPEAPAAAQPVEAVEEVVEAVIPAEEPVAEAPVEAAPAAEAPVEASAEETAPAPVEAVEQTAEADLPAEEPVMEAPVETAPVAEAPVETPAEEPASVPVEAVEQTVEDEAPAAEPVEETVVEAAPSVETPTDEPAPVPVEADEQTVEAEAPAAEPVEEEPVETAPVAETPAEEPAPAPVEAVEETVEAEVPAAEPVEEAPVETAPVAETPVEEPAPAPVDAVEAEPPAPEPVQEAPVETAPVTETPVESPAEEPEPTPVETAPVAEAPAEAPGATPPAPPAPSLDQPVDSEGELAVESPEQEPVAEAAPETDDPVEPAAPETPVNVINGTNKADFIVGTDGDDRIIGLRGADKMKGGEGDDVYVFTADAKNGADVFDDGRDGDGYDVALAAEAGVVIGVDGYNDGRSFTSKGVTVTNTGVDAFEGQGDTIIRDGNSARTLDFSDTSLEGILEIDAGGGNDKLFASDLSDAAYRGGAGNDQLTAGKADATWLYGAGKNGADTFVNGEGFSVAQATDKGVVIGVNGFANGVDAFEGAGDTVIRDGNSSRTLDFSNTELTGVLQIDAAGGNDTVIASNLSDGAYRGGSGNDTLTAGSKETTWLYSAGNNGSDSFVNGEGRSVAFATGEKVVIGVNGYENGVDAFEGQGDTVIQDSNSSRTLDFSDTELSGIAEIDARGGNDTVVASNLSDGAYRGGSGDDTLTAGAKETTWLYGAGDNGHDTFANGEGFSVAQATDEGVVIGVNGFANGVDAFEGAGDTVIRDGNSSRTLDFSDTELSGIAEIDARGGNDTVVASNLSDAAYRGGSGDDSLTAGSARAVWLYGEGENGRDNFVNGEGVSIAQAEGSGVTIGLNGYVNGVDGFRGAGDTVIEDGNSSRTLDFSSTAFKDIALVDGAGGNDTLIASDLSEAAYAGGSGDDTLIAGDQRTVWVYGSGDNGRDVFVNGDGASIAQATDKGVVIGVNGYANGVDGFLGVGDTVIRDGGSSRALDFSNTALKGVAEIDGGGGNDTITLSNLSEGSYRGGAGNDVFVVQRGAESATIADFDDSGNDRIDLSAFGSDLGAIQKATTLTDSDGDGKADDVQIDLAALGGEKGSTLTLLDTDLSALNFGTKKGDFIVAKAGAGPSGDGPLDDDGAAEKLFTFDMDSLDPASGWTAELDGKGAEADGADPFFEHGADSSGVIVFEDGSDNVFASINDSQW